MQIATVPLLAHSHLKLCRQETEDLGLKGCSQVVEVTELCLSCKPAISCTDVVHTTCRCTWGGQGKGGGGGSEWAMASQA